MQNLEAIIGRPADRPFFDPESKLWEGVPVEAVRQVAPYCTQSDGVAVLCDPEGTYHVIQGPFSTIWRCLNPQSYYGAGLAAPCAVINVPSEAI